jgi:phosphoenolpyruvate-protein phosphotransferase (PTS system enzyme I)
LVRIEGVPLSPGVAVGVLTCVVAQSLPSRRVPQDSAEIERELALLDSGKAAFESQLMKREERLRAALGDDEADLIEGFREIVFDQETLLGVRETIRKGRLDAPHALLEAGEAHARELELLEDPYLRERATDFRALFREFASVLVKETGGLASDSSKSTDFDCNRTTSVLCCQEISVIDLLSFENGELAGIVTSTTSKTSHGIILARSMGLPVVGGVSFEPARSVRVIVDGSTGTVVMDPDDAEVEAARELMEAEIAAASELETLRGVLVPGKHNAPVRFTANIGLPVQAEEALRRGAEGVGLMRTEFLFMGSNSASLPSEQSQTSVYRSVLLAMKDRPVKIRTLDAGGDKPVPGLTKEGESNPFLGLRSIRLSLSEQKVFRTQVRALLRASTYGNLHIMFPMIISVEELREAKRVLAEERAELARQGVAMSVSIPVGIMVETPAAALIASELAAESDFFSVGTNDLTQYILAVDRGNDAVASLYDSSHPAVVRALVEIAESAQAAGIPASVCGEMAGTPEHARRLIDMGYDELSMDAVSILRVKASLIR